MTIKIESKLTANQAARLRRRAKLDHSEFSHVGRNEYCTTNDEIEEMQVSHLHATARKMMVVAGTTFRYEIQ